MSEPIYHLALAGEWADACLSGEYRRSTLGKSLEDEGFIHCSFGHQLQAIADLLYRGRPDVLLLHIDPGLVESEIRVENVDGGSDAFPHIYGPLFTSAVARVEALMADQTGRLTIGERSVG